MKTKLSFLLTMLLLVCAVGTANALVYTYTAGDVDYAADRDAYDNATNMDYYVFKAGSSTTGAATNSLGYVQWGYELPYAIETANSGSMTIRSWDIDPADVVEVYFNFNGVREYAGLLTGSNGGNISTWESAVANGTTASLNGWNTTTFTFSASLLAALSNSTGFELELDVQNEAVSWAAVIDFASITLDYTEGAPNPNTNPVPEPATMILLGTGLLGVFGSRKKAKK